MRQIPQTNKFYGADKQDAIVGKELHQRKGELARYTYEKDVQISKEREHEVCLVFD